MKRREKRLFFALPCALLLSMAVTEGLLLIQGRWKEAIPLVEQLSIPAAQKNKIIEIIRTCSDQAHCEKMLRSHADLYNILKRDVLPQLRDATYTVNYVQNIY